MHFLKILLSSIFLLYCLFLGPTTTYYSYAQAAENIPLRVGYFAFPGYHNLEENGHRSGYGYDFLQNLGRYSEFTYTYVGYDQDWAKMLSLLENGDIDLVTSAQKTPEREALFAFSNKPIGKSSTILTVKAGNSRLIPGDYSSYNGMRVGMINNNSRNKDFVSFAAEKGFSYKPIYFASLKEMTLALQYGVKIDAIVTSNLRQIEKEWIIEKFAPSDFYVMVRKNDTKLLAKINYAIEAMDDSIPDWRNKLFERYYTPDNGSEIALSVAERAFLAKAKADNKVFTVLVNPDRAPYSYFEKGEAKGILVTIFKEAAARAGISYKIIEPENRQKYETMARNHSVDIRLDAPFDYYQAEKNGYKLTEAYFTTTISMLTRKGFSGKPTTVAVLHQADNSTFFANTIYQDVILQYFTSMDECVKAVKEGVVDCTYLYTYAAQHYMSQDERNELTVKLLPDHSVSFAVAVGANLDHRLLAILGKAINSTTNSFAQKTAWEQTTDLKHASTLTSFVYDNPLVIIILSVLLLAFIFALILSYMRMKSARRLQLQATDKLRMLGYICKVNDMVLEINLGDETAHRHYLENNTVCTVTEPYPYKDFKNLFLPKDWARIAPLVDKKHLFGIVNNQKDSIYFEGRCRKEENDYNWYSFTIQAIPKDEMHPHNIILMRKDIDAFKKEQELKQRTLKDALESARRAGEAKGAFLSRMSHEIRTPLNAILGYLTLVRSTEKITKEQLDYYLTNCENASKHLLRLINDVLDISSIESGRMKIAMSDFDLKQLLTNIAAIFYAQGAAKNVKFGIVLNHLSEEWVCGDSLRLNQILANLLSNAVKFTSDGGQVKLLVTQMSLEEDTVLLRFSISDTGVGMSEEYLQRIFKPFEQESATTAQSFGGTGLGLSIAHNLVSMMHGSLEVKSAKGEGTTFTVVLPFKRSKENTLLHSHTHDFSKVRTLIVDDEKDTCDYIKTILKRYSIKADTVYSGEDAVKQIKRREGSDYAYNLCLMDWNMPGMDGIATAKKIRQECHSDLPIIIASAYDTSAITEEAKAAGVIKIVAKPLFQSTLFDLLVSTFGSNLPEATALPTQRQLKNFHVLLAEDNDMNREIAVLLLKKAGITVDTAVNGQEAVDKFLQAQEDTYQAILMDIQMPLMNGFEATKTIRNSSHPRANSIPIIAMTANAFAEDVSAALANGMNDHIAKPIDFAKLLDVLQKYALGKED